MIVAKMVGSILKGKIDQKIFGGAIGRNTERFEKGLFYFKLAKILLTLKKENAEKVGREVVEDLKSATPVDTGKLRDSARFEGNKGGGQIITGGTPETMKQFKGGVFDQALGIEYGTTTRP